MRPAASERPGTGPAALAVLAAVAGPGSAKALVDPAVQPRLPTAPANFATALELDAAWWAEHLERLTRRFEAWIDRPVRVPQALPR